MHTFIKSLLITSCMFLLGACYRSATPVVTRTCELKLQLSVHQGFSAGRTMTGQVDFGSDVWSSFKRGFVDASGQSHPGSFSFSGQAIHFIIELEQGPVFATGVMESSLATCSGSGGGTLSGPLVGDLGDWRGEWIATALPAPSEQPSTISQPSAFSTFFSFLPFIVFWLFLAGFLFYLLAPYKLRNLFKRTPSSKQQGSNSDLRRIHQTKKSEPGNENQPIIEYLATYTADDKLFDLSFAIEESSTDLGECGITVAKVLNANSGQVAALELWLFDSHGPQTISKILASHFCFSQADIQSELQKIGQLNLAQPGKIVVLETSRLKAEARVLQVEYEPNSPIPQSLFKKVVIQIKVWKNTSTPA